MIKMLSLVGSNNNSSILFRVPIGLSNKLLLMRSCSSSSVARCSTLQPPDVAHLAGTARITLSPKEVEDFAPKIRQVIDWFGQLQAVDLQSVEPSLRAETLNLWRGKYCCANTPSKVDLSRGPRRFLGPVHNLLVVETRNMGGSDTELGANPREDIPEEFPNRDAIVAEIPSFTDPYIKVPRVLNKE